jgi:hypothetical protein
VLRLKELVRGGSATPIDWIAAVICFGASGCLVGFGAFHPAWVQHMGIVSIVFGLIGIRAAVAEMWRFVKKPTEKMFWWYSHLGNFIGSYIAAWSAFSVVTLGPMLGNRWYVWLWPTMIGVPAIFVTTAYYKRKFAPRMEVAV